MENNYRLLTEFASKNNIKSIEFAPNDNSPLVAGEAKNNSLFLRPDDVIFRSVIENNQWDIETINFFDSALQKSKFEKIEFVDIGANIGLISRQILGRFDNKINQVFCYEPSIENFIILNRNLSFSDKVKSFHYGLGNKSEEINLYKDPYNIGNYSTMNSDQLFGYLSTEEGVKYEGKNKVEQELIKIESIQKESKKWIESGNNIFFKSDTQGNDISIATSLPLEIWNNNIFACVMEIIPLANNIFSLYRFSKILDLFERKAFVSNPQRPLSTDEIIDYIESMGLETNLIMTKN